MDNQHQIIPFEGQNIRRIEHQGDMYFSIVDVVGVLTDSPTPRNYWAKIKKQITDESQTLPIWKQLKLPAPDQKMRLTDCATQAGVLRIIQSIPSPKAEPFKLWLADLGKQAIAEAHDPELLSKGYPEDWIGERLKTIEIRRELTDEWQNRGVKEGQEYSILTATIAKGTFGMTPAEHSELKGLDRQNLRDHMTRMELILTAFSEEATRIITVNNDAQGFTENQDAAERGGEIGRKARMNFEQGTGTKIVSPENFLGLKDANDPTKTLPEGE
jgi:DNA-damage-inducible protein D